VDMYLQYINKPTGVGFVSTVNEHRDLWGVQSHWMPWNYCSPLLLYKVLKVPYHNHRHFCELLYSFSYFLWTILHSFIFCYDFSVNKSQAQRFPVIKAASMGFWWSIKKLQAW